MVPGYQILQIINQCLYWCKFLQVIFWYCSYPWVEQLIRGLVDLDISFSCRFKGIRVTEHVFWDSSFSTSDAKGPGNRRLWVFIAKEADRTGDRRPRRYHNSWCKNTLRDLLEGFPDFGLFSSTAKYQDFRLSASRLKEFCCTLQISVHS